MEITIGGWYSARSFLALIIILTLLLALPANRNLHAVVIALPYVAAGVLLSESLQVVPLWHHLARFIRGSLLGLTAPLLVAPLLRGHRGWRVALGCALCMALGAAEPMISAPISADVLWSTAGLAIFLGGIFATLAGAAVMLRGRPLRLRPYLIRISMSGTAAGVACAALGTATIVLANLGNGAIPFLPLLLGFLGLMVVAIPTMVAVGVGTGFLCAVPALSARLLPLVSQPPPLPPPTVPVPPR